MNYNLPQVMQLTVALGLPHFPWKDPLESPADSGFSTGLLARNSPPPHTGPGGFLRHFHAGKPPAPLDAPGLFTQTQQQTLQAPQDLGHQGRTLPVEFVGSMQAPGPGLQPPPARSDWRLWPRWAQPVSRRGPRTVSGRNGEPLGAK